jgi:GNAT superfamily N-acetyltransferase
MRQAKIRKHHQVIYPSPIVYREEVIPADLDNVREIIASHSLFSRDEVELAVELVQERLIKGARSGYQFLFAERAGRVIGYSCFGPIACTQGSYDLYWIAVQGDLLGAGLGRELLKQSEDMMTGQGARAIYIETSFRDEYKPTRLFYEKCGYHLEAVLKDFYSPGDAKIIFVKLMLNQT